MVNPSVSGGEEMNEALQIRFLGGSRLIFPLCGIVEMLNVEILIFASAIVLLAKNIMHNELQKVLLSSQRESA